LVQPASERATTTRQIKLTEINAMRESLQAYAHYYHAVAVEWLDLPDIMVEITGSSWHDLGAIIFGCVDYAAEQSKAAVDLHWSQQTDGFMIQIVFQTAHGASLKPFNEQVEAAGKALNVIIARPAPRPHENIALKIDYHDVLLTIPRSGTGAMRL
jgi:hypothetical protein